MNDHELLRDFAEHGSQSAFRQLVDRHVALVHSTARRRVGDPHQAEDVTQQVFTLLAAKARHLGSQVVLSGWLYRTAVNVALETVRHETRRQRREQAAVEAVNLNESDATWREIEPWLDAAMATLSEPDRDAVVLRFFENRSLREVGVALGVSDDAAQKRLSRAVEKLREFFARRGRVVVGTTLTAAIATGAIQSVPAGLASSVAAAALAGAPVVAASATALTFMSLKPIVGLMGAVGAASVLFYQQVQLRSARDANAELAVRVEQAGRTALDTEQRMKALQVTTENDPRILELAKLRGEVAGLRRETSRLKEENTVLNAALREAAREVARQEGSETPEMEAVKDRGIARLNYAKQWMLALVLHAEDHSGRLPDALDQATAYFGQAGDGGMSPAQQEFYRSLTADQFELTYRGALAALTNPSRTIVVREKEAWPVPGKPGLSRTYGFADGHSEIKYADDGRFDDWERERSVTP